MSNVSALDNFGIYKEGHYPSYETEAQYSLVIYTKL